MNHFYKCVQVQVNAQGLAALAGGLKNLTELDVGGCQRVDDSALRALCSTNAQFLNLSGCAAITETGVAGIAMNCTALSSLNVTGYDCCRFALDVAVVVIGNVPTA